MTEQNQGHEPAQKYLTRAEAAKHLGVTPRWLATSGYGKVPHLTFGHKTIRYAVADLDAWANAQREA